MKFLKLEVNKPVRLEVLGEPQIENGQYGVQYQYTVMVDGEQMIYSASQNVNNKIEDFIRNNGNQLCLIKSSYQSPQGPRQSINVEPFDITNAPQNAPAYGQTRTQYAKSQPVQPKQEYPTVDWAKKERDMEIGNFKNMASRLLPHMEDLKGRSYDDVAKMARTLVGALDKAFNEKMATPQPEVKSALNEPMEDLPF